MDKVALFRWLTRTTERKMEKKQKNKRERKLVFFSPCHIAYENDDDDQMIYW